MTTSNPDQLHSQHDRGVGSRVERHDGHRVHAPGSRGEVSGQRVDVADRGYERSEAGAGRHEGRDEAEDGGSDTAREAQRLAVETPPDPEANDCVGGVEHGRRPGSNAHPESAERGRHDEWPDEGPGREAQPRSEQHAGEGEGGGGGEAPWGRQVRVEGGEGPGRLRPGRQESRHERHGQDGEQQARTA